MWDRINLAYNNSTIHKGKHNSSIINDFSMQKMYISWPGWHSMSCSFGLLFPFSECIQLCCMQGIRVPRHNKIMDRWSLCIHLYMDSNLSSIACYLCEYGNGLFNLFVPQLPYLPVGVTMPPLQDLWKELGVHM